MEWRERDRNFNALYISSQHTLLTISTSVISLVQEKYSEISKYFLKKRVSLKYLRLTFLSQSSE